MIDIQTTHAKLSSQDGNSREHGFKVPNDCSVKIKDVDKFLYSCKVSLVVATYNERNVTTHQQYGLLRRKFNGS